MPSVVGVFLGREETETAIDQLVDLGVDQDALGVVWRERAEPVKEEIEITVYIDHFEEPAVEARKGAIGGAVAGGATGVGSVLLATAGGVVLATPIGALMAVGTLAAAAIAGTAGVVGGGLTGGLIGALLGATDHDATKITRTETEYRDAIVRDGFVVTVDVEEALVDETVAAFDQVGANDISVIRARTDIRTVVKRQE